MAFMILFSALSSSWAGISSHVSEPSDLSSIETSADAQMSHHGHVCPSMAMVSAETVTSLSDSVCPHGFSDCQCAAGCPLNAPLVSTSAYQFHSVLRQQGVNLPLVVALAVTDPQSLDRPPRFH